MVSAHLPRRLLFEKVSYDRILGDKVNEFSATNPTVPFHEVIDIIRPKADKQYLDDIARHMLNSNNTTAFMHSEHSKEDMQVNENDVMSIIYCDRNNTSDIWADLKNNFDHIGQQTPSMLTRGIKDFRTVVLLPKMEEWPIDMYREKNPICPHFIYECIKRIFGRKDHNCLSAANKPKAVEVVLKFAKLHDGFNFDD